MNVKCKINTKENKMKRFLSLFVALISVACFNMSYAGVGEGYGIITISVAQMHTKPDFSSELDTQALLGTPIRVLADEGWYKVQTPDNYQAWTHHKSVYLATRAEVIAWNEAEKVVVTSHYAFCYSAPVIGAIPVSDVVAGCRLKLIGTKGKFYVVEYPDGRRGYLEKKVAMPLEKWRKRLKQDAESILATAKTLMGVPYLWSGMSSKAVDCSGFVRTVLFLHDIIIPRNASQQAKTGDLIEIAQNFSNLQPGDLIFFGRKASETQKERVSHVGISLGGARFIHSQGDVHISSFDEVDPLFDAYNLGRLMYARRVLPYINKVPELNTTDVNPYYASNF